MIKLNGSIFINRSTEEVFSFVSNFENDKYWVSGVVGTEKVTEGPIAVGTKFVETNKFILGMKVKAPFVITGYEPNKRITYKSTSGPAIFQGSYTCEPVEGGTRFVVNGEGKLRGPLKLIEPLLARKFQSQLEPGLAKLKHFLEARTEGN